MEKMEKLHQHSPFCCKRALFPDLFCKHFLPLSEFFLAHPPVPISSPVPLYSQTLRGNLRDNLSSSRQMKYLRRTVSHDYCESQARAFLEEPGYEPYGRQGNRSLVLNERLLWASQSKIKQISLRNIIDEFKRNDHFQIPITTPQEVIDLHQKIHELLLFQQTRVLARSARAVFVLDPTQQLILHKYSFEAEVTALWTYSDQLFFSLFDGSNTWFQTTNSSQHTLPALVPAKMGHLLHIHPISAGWNLTRNQLVLCTNQALLLFDRRANTVNQMVSAPNRIFTGISLDTISRANLFTLAQTYSINLYDIRNTSSPILELPHFSQESPPSILQVFDPNYPSCPTPDQQVQLHLKKNPHLPPLLTAHSPYPLGSAFFFDLDSGLQTSEWEMEGRSFVSSNSLSMLYDGGKIDRFRYPCSVSKLILGDYTTFVHLDNFEGVGLQFWERRRVGAKGVGREKERWQWSRVDLEKAMSHGALEDGNWEWFWKRNLERTTSRKEKDYWQEYLESEEKDLQLEPQQSEQRYLRFADLSVFYEQVFQKAKTHPLTADRLQAENDQTAQHLKHSNQVQSTFGSLEPTLPSQGLQDQLGTNVCLTLEQMFHLNQEWEHN